MNNTTLNKIGNDSTIELRTNPYWTKEIITTVPRGRSGHAMTTIWGTDKVLIFGGEYWNGATMVYLNDTWIYDLSDNNWTEKHPPNTPSKRRYHDVAMIWGTDKVLLYAGEPKNPPGAELNDTWIYDLSNNTWTQMKTLAWPPRRSWLTLSSIYNDDKVLLFGGEKDVVGRYRDTWIYDLSENNWTLKNPVNKPKGRHGQGMAFIHGQDKIVLFGGFADPVLRDTWIYDVSDDNWTRVYPENKPLPHTVMEMATIYNTDKVLLFGGMVNENNETWVYDLGDNNWANITGDYNPEKRSHFGMASIYKSDKTILFGGVSLVSGNRKKDTWIHKFNNYIDKGYFISTPILLSQNSTLKTIEWNIKTNINTSIKFQLRSASNEMNLISKQFVGPDGTISTYYTTSQSNIWSGHKGDNCLQYKAYFNTVNPNETPVFENITFYYNCWPQSSLFSPIDDSIIKDNKPLFIWNFSDSDSIQQTNFQIIIDNDINFNNIDYDSGNQESITNNWQFPNGTGHSEIADGTWYWKVRTKDNDGDWGLYSSPWKIIIDSKHPNSTITFPQNNGFYPKLNLIKGTSKDYKPKTGLNRTEISIERLSDNYTWDGTQWINEENWLNTSGFKNWIYNSSTINWDVGIQYKVQSRAIDNASNIEIETSTSIFTIDIAYPTSNIEFPINNTYINNLRNISGISTDIGEAGVSLTMINIKSINENKYWNGEHWIIIDTWLPTIGENNWFYNSEMLPLTSGNEYNIRSKAIDKANNIEIPDNGNTFIFDDEDVLFSNPIPLTFDISPIKNVKVGITISDLLSGVNASSIEYAKSIDKGKTWDSWIPIKGFENSSEIQVTINLDFKNGTENRLKWRACDIVGNGPKESGIYTILIDTSLQRNLPNVKLISPENVSTVIEQNIELKWSLLNPEFEDVTYDIILDTIYPPEKINKSDHTTNSYQIDDLENGKTYYWTIRPKKGIELGICYSGIWSFKYDNTVKIPVVNLRSPIDKQTITTIKPTLSWSLSYEGTETVTYDMYLSTNSIPDLYRSNHSNTHFIPDPVLEIDKTYFWKIVPIAGKIIGPASDIYSFHINIKAQVPYVTLKSPKENDIMIEKNPKLLWSVFYNGEEDLVYDLYFGIDPNPDLYIEDHPSTEYLFDIELEDGQTYYWKVVPKAGGIIGSSSPIWSFKIDTSYKPNIDFTIILDKSKIELKPGENSTIIATIKNIGELKDNISINFKLDNNLGIIVRILEPFYQEIEPDKSAEFQISISIPSTIPAQSITIKFEAISELALNYQLESKKETSITLTILDKTEPTKPKEPTEDINFFSSTLGISVILILIVVVIVLIVTVLFLKRKKQKKDKLEEISSTSTPQVIPSTQDNKALQPESQTTPQSTIQKQPQQSIQQPKVTEPGQSQSIIHESTSNEDQQTPQLQTETQTTTIDTSQSPSVPQPTGH